MAIITQKHIYVIVARRVYFQL